MGVKTRRKKRTTRKRKSHKLRKQFGGAILTIEELDKLVGEINYENQTDFDRDMYHLFDVIKILLKSDRDIQVVRSKITDVLSKTTGTQIVINENVDKLMKFIIEFINKKMETHTESYKTSKQLIEGFLTELQNINIESVDDFLKKYKSVKVDKFAEATELLIGENLLRETQLLKYVDDNYKKLIALDNSDVLKNGVIDLTAFKHFKQVIIVINNKISEHKQFFNSFVFIDKFYSELNTVFETEKNVDAVLNKVDNMLKTIPKLQNDKTIFDVFSKFIKNRYDCVEIIDVIITYKKFYEKLVQMESTHVKKNGDNSIQKLKDLFIKITGEYDFLTMTVKNIETPNEPSSAMSEEQLLDLFKNKGKNNNNSKKNKTKKLPRVLSVASMIPAVEPEKIIHVVEPEATITPVVESETSIIPLVESEATTESDKIGGGEELPMVLPPPPPKAESSLTPIEKELRNLNKKLAAIQKLKTDYKNKLNDLTAEQKTKMNGEKDVIAEIKKVQKVIEVRKNFWEMKRTSDELCVPFGSDRIVQTLLNVNVGQMCSFIYTDFNEFVKFFETEPLFKYAFHVTSEYNYGTSPDVFKKLYCVILFAIGYLNSMLLYYGIQIPVFGFKGGINLKLTIAMLIVNHGLKIDANMEELLRTNDIDISVNVLPEMENNKNYKKCISQLLSNVIYETFYYDLIHFEQADLNKPKFNIFYKAPDDDILPVVADDAKTELVKNISTVYKFSTKTTEGGGFIPIVDIDPGIIEIEMKDKEFIQYAPLKNKKQMRYELPYTVVFKGVQLAFHCQTIDYFVSDKIGFHLFYKKLAQKYKDNESTKKDYAFYAKYFYKFNRYIKFFKGLIQNNPDFDLDKSQIEFLKDPNIEFMDLLDSLESKIKMNKLNKMNELNKMNK
jgi:hypothetical protein